MNRERCIDALSVACILGVFVLGLVTQHEYWVLIMLGGGLGILLGYVTAAVRCKGRNCK